MKIAIVTDAWTPQVNGVVRTLQAVRDVLERGGNEVLVISPDLYRSIPCPTYPEIRLALATAGAVGARVAAFAPDAVHLSTEGPLCVAARRWCLDRGLPFTTAYHTQFPEYLAKRTKLPASLFWRYICWFHGPSEAVMVSTNSVRKQLLGHGIGPVRTWGRGVDLENFTPDAPPPALFSELPRPIMLYVGRVAIEKNIEAFLKATHPGSKVIVGDGPILARLEAQFPEAHFLGSLAGRALAGAYAGADVFVFPSKTDTFGLVMIEALACGTPVAAYPVSGPADVIDETVGALDADLNKAIARALTRDRQACRACGETFSWEASAAQFRAALAPGLAAPTLVALPSPEPGLPFGEHGVKRTAMSWPLRKGRPFFCLKGFRPWLSPSCRTPPLPGWSTIRRLASSRSPLFAAFISSKCRPSPTIPPRPS